MPPPPFDEIFTKITHDPMNAAYLREGMLPVYQAGPNAKILIVGQAPGRKAQDTGTPWNDVSGDNLRKWLGVDRTLFYDPEYFALVPMDFYYPGKGTHGDLPPRPGFAAKWHPMLLEAMPNLQLTLPVGAYAQSFYLHEGKKRNLTDTVRAYQTYLPDFLPLVHPSPLNFRWRARNPWFEAEVVPTLQALVANILKS